MKRDIEEVLIDRHRIAERVHEVAQQILADLQRETVSGQMLDITLVPILTGSLIFVADLIRHLPLKMRIRLISLSSYPGTATQSQGVTVQSPLTDWPSDLSSQHVLLIDDILDSGRTLQTAKELLAKRSPATLRTCVLLRKERPGIMRQDADYACFDIPDRFIVGYGLDYNGYYRNVPDIVVLKPQVFSPSDTV